MAVTRLMRASSQREILTLATELSSMKLQISRWVSLRNWEVLYQTCRPVMTRMMAPMERTSLFLMDRFMFTSL